jgi:hypothetical protein
MKTAFREAWAAFDGTALFAAGNPSAQVCVAHEGEQIAAEHIRKYFNAGLFFK